MYPHRIRLRGPWELEQFGKRRATVPCRWADIGVTVGPVILRRRFGYPGQIDSQERVWLTFGGCEDHGEARLNNRRLGTLGHDPVEFDVTSLLDQRNQLEVRVDAPAPQGGLDEVALEVRRTAFLQGVSAHTRGDTLEVKGAVVGTCDGPLDLYVLAGRSTLAYITVETQPEAARFQIDAKPHEGDPAPQTVRVELVRGAVIWYAVETCVEK